MLQRLLRSDENDEIIRGMLLISLLMLKITNLLPRLFFYFRFRVSSRVMCIIVVDCRMKLVEIAMIC